jgi:hypothetical protein
MSMRSIASALVALAVLVACTASGMTGTPVAEPTLDLKPGRGRAAKSALMDAACALPHEYVVRIARGYRRGRSPDVYSIPAEPNY